MKKTDTKIFELYKKVQQKDRAAEDKFIAIYHEKFPGTVVGRELVRGSPHFRTMLHAAYLHLTR